MGGDGMGNISWSNAGGLSWSNPILGAGVVKLARWASHWVGNLSASKCVWKRLTRNDDHVIYSFGIKLSKYLLLKSVEWWVLHSTGTFAVILRSTTTSMKFRTDTSKADWQNLSISLILLRGDDEMFCDNGRWAKCTCRLYPFVWLPDDCQDLHLFNAKVYIYEKDETHFYFVLIMGHDTIPFVFCTKNKTTFPPSKIIIKLALQKPNKNKVAWNGVTHLNTKWRTCPNKNDNSKVLVLHTQAQEKEGDILKNLNTQW